MQNEHKKRPRSTFREWESLTFMIGMLIIHGGTLIFIFLLAKEWHGQDNENSLLTPELIHTIITGSFTLLNLMGGFFFGRMTGEANARRAMTIENSNDE